MFTGLIVNFVTGFFTDWIDERKDKRAVKKAVSESKIKLAQSDQSHNQNWELEALQGRDTWLRRFSFALFTFPLIWAGFDPQSAQVYFTQALAALPDWYIGVYMGIMSAIWGISELKKWKS